MVRTRTHATVSMRAVVKNPPVFRRTRDGDLVNLTLKVKQDSQGGEWLDYDAVAFNQAVVARCRALEAGMLVSVWGRFQSWKRKDRHGYAVKIRIERIAVDGGRSLASEVFHHRREQERPENGPLARYVALVVEGTAEKAELEAAYALVPESQHSLIPAAVRCMQAVVKRERERRNTTGKMVSLR
ncbi:single-stranded DNA-binding protein [Desulfoferrobacter suflitae]|uniref:single-stranded DNA-binding protein n=1 Tax=Desulfoferrobacter suflitae TaxID=2865782 RepID=UPI002164A5CE|nr:hypothetical protein [Desulfoferrobacter suflitae]MCK8603782.1 hypothetical protein [Desulfoferrobacter suflitae]